MSAPWESARLAAWADAFLAGEVSPDDLVDAVTLGAVHRATGLSGNGEGAEALPIALGRLRAAGATTAWLVWPAPGDAAGLPGPAGTNRVALEAGQAVVVDGPAPAVGCALVPSRLGSSGVVWTAFPAERPAAARTSLADADRDLKVAVREATQALAALDVARTPAGAEHLVEAARTRSAQLVPPPGFPADARVLLDTAQRLHALLELAVADEGGALTAAESGERRDVLRDLGRTVRHAFAAAINARAEHRTRAG